MGFDAQGIFKVGNTTLKTLMRVRIPDYGYDLPEINASSPMIMPIMARVKYIINWLERDIRVDFVNGMKDAQKLMFFLLEYNLYAAEANKHNDDIDTQLTVAINAQSYLMRELNYQDTIGERKSAEKVPFKRSIYKKINRRKLGQIPYTGKFNKPKDAKNQPIPEVFKPGDVFAFDIFGEVPDPQVADSSSFFRSVKFDMTR
jgi:hypothetical protein